MSTNRLLIYVYLVFIPLFNSCTSQYYPGLTSSAVDSLHSAYREDAMRLALHKMIEAGSDQVEIPQDTVDKYLSHLISIHAFVKSRGDDSLAPVLSTHSFPNPSLQNAIVVVQPNTSWVQGWLRDGENKIRDEKLKNLINTYGLSAKELSSSVQNTFLLIQSRSKLNTYALAEELKSLGGVLEAEPEMTAGDGQDIIVKREGKNYVYRFMRGEGDCPSGCIHKKYWMFEISHSGRVSYLGSEGHLPSLSQ